MGFMQQFQPNQQQVGLGAQMSTLRQIMQGDHSAAINNLMQTNPNFAQFVAQHRGQSIQEAFKSYGYDLNDVLSLINLNS